MSLTIEIPSPLAERIIAAAERAGVPVEEHATRLLEDATETFDRKPVDLRESPARALNEIAAKHPVTNADAKLHRASAFGKYAHLPISSYDYAKEKQAEIEREDRRFR